MVLVAKIKASLAELSQCHVVLVMKKVNCHAEMNLETRFLLRPSPRGWHALQDRRLSARRGFTLVEMLVTVAVIAVVAAIAFFGGGAALRSAKSAKATSHLKKTGMIVANYAGENSNRLPPSADWGAIMYGGELRYFQRYLCDFAGFTWNDSKPTSPLPDFFYDPVLEGKRQHPMGSFAVNHSIVLNTWDCRRFGHELGTPIMSIPNPSSKVIYCSAKEPGWDSTWLFVGEDFSRLGWQAASGPDARYSGRAGALFLDGHVENLDVKSMDQAKRRRYFTSDP